MEKDRQREPRRRYPLALILAAAGLFLGLASGIGYDALESRLSAAPTSLEEAADHLEAALEDSNDFRRVGRIARILRDIGPPGDDESGQPAIGEIRRVFESSKMYDGAIEFALFASWWARSDPRSAYRWKTYAPQGRGESVLVAIAEEWGRSDLVEAFRAVRSERSDDLRVSGFGAALLGAESAGVDDRQILAALAEAPDRGERRRALQRLLDRRLAETSKGGGPNVEELIAWSKQIGPASPEITEDLIAASAIAVASVAPERSARELSRHHAESQSPLPSGALEAVAARWASTDPKATLEWISTFDPSEEQMAAVRISFQRWLVQERSVALEWAAERVTEGVGDWFNPIRVLYGRILGEKDPAAGLLVLFDLPVDTMRAGAVEKVFARWKATAPDAAEAWLSEVELPDFRKQELRNRPAAARRTPKETDSRGEASSSGGEAS